MTRSAPVGVVTIVARPVIDHFVHVDVLPRPGGKVLVAGRSVHFGGVADNFAVQVARLGGRSTVWGEAGTDAASESAVRALADEGVDLVGLARVEGRRPLTSEVIVDRAGERMILVDLPDDLAATCDAVAGTIAQAGAAPAALAYLGAWQPALVGVARAIDALGMPWACTLEAAVPPFPAHDVGPAAVVFADPAALDAHRATANVIGAQTIVVLTDGAHGAGAHVDGREVATHPAFAVDVVDTTGAGDCFAATFVMARLQGSEPATALRRAAAAAAICVSSMGSRSGPTVAELEQFLAGHPPRGVDAG